METTDQPFMLDAPDEEQFLAAAGQLLGERQERSAALLEQVENYRSLAHQDAKDALALLKE